MILKNLLTDGDDEKTEIFDKFQKNFIKYKDEYFDIKKTAGSTAYVKFKHHHQKKENFPTKNTEVMNGTKVKN